MIGANLSHHPPTITADKRIGDWKTTMLYEFTKFELDVFEFHSLVFMNPPQWWREQAQDHEFLLSICCQPLNEVVKSVKQRAGIKEDVVNPYDVFENLQDIRAFDKNGNEEKDPWFKPHLDMCETFDLDIMPPIWIRNLSEGFHGCERKKCPKGSYYMEDGNTRALVYALTVSGKPIQNVKPFPAIHANSWALASGELGHLPQRIEVLENKGAFPYKRKHKKSVHLPIGIGVDWYQGSSRQNRH
ncbi:MAG: hypothetical protein OXU23_03495 [Candidatus Poribacteria bacterium]|nr:hypothetical protein [Candidatus Poribacteria bacterium]